VVVKRKFSVANVWNGAALRPFPHIRCQRFAALKNNLEQPGDYHENALENSVGCVGYSEPTVHCRAGERHTIVSVAGT
jgi:hypothetical protein